MRKAHSDSTECVGRGAQLLADSPIALAGKFQEAAGTMPTTLTEHIVCCIGATRGGCVGGMSPEGHGFERRKKASERPGRGSLARGQPCGSRPGRKPNSVPPKGWRPFVWARPLLGGSSSLPGAYTGPEAGTGRGGPLLPIWPCSRWGLPCRTCHQARGELLPRHFTLTEAEAQAVCFLWHFPYPCGRWPLATTVPHGVRTFLPDPCGSRRPPGPPAAGVSVHLPNARSGARLRDAPRTLAAVDAWCDGTILA